MHSSDWKWLRGGLLALTVAGVSLNFTACSDDEDEEETTGYQPEYVAGTTSAAGVAALDLDNYDVAVTVLDDNNQPVSGAAVDVFQGEDYALLWVELAGYYPALRVLELGTTELYTINLQLIDAGGFFQTFETEPEHIAHLLNDGSVTAHCYEGTLADIYSSALTTLGSYWAIRATGEVAALGGGGNINLGLFTYGLSPEYFEQLMFGATSLYEGDVVEYCFFSINVGGVEYYLPYVQLSDVVSQQDTEYAYKFILTWGQDPSDLDSHLFTPEIDGSTYHVYYGNRGASDYAPFAWLDVDDVTSWGPEATTIETLYPGTYTFAIYEFSGSGTLSTSGAQVEVFHGRTQVGTYQVPTTPDGDHWWWTVGTVDGATGTFTPVNTLTSGAPVAAPRQLEPMPTK